MSSTVCNIEVEGQIDRSIPTSTIITNNNIKRILVNRHKVQSNKANNEFAPVLSINTSDGVVYGHDIELLSDDGTVVARFRQMPDRPLSCGATVYLETNMKVRALRYNDID